MSLDTAGSRGHSAAIGRERRTRNFRRKMPGGLSIASYVYLCYMFLCVINSLHSQLPVWPVGVERAEGEFDVVWCECVSTYILLTLYWLIPMLF